MYGHCRTGSKTWTPASVVHKTSPYWWMADAGVRIVAFPIAANTMARNGTGQIQDFFLDVGVRHMPTSRKKKKTKFASFRSVPSYFWCDPAIRKATICQHPPTINKRKFYGQQTPAFRFLTRSGSDHTSVSQTGVFPVFRKLFLTKTSMTIPRSHRLGFFITFLT